MTQPSTPSSLKIIWFVVKILCHRYDIPKEMTTIPEYWKGDTLNRMAYL